MHPLFRRANAGTFLLLLAAVMILDGGVVHAQTEPEQTFAAHVVDVKDGDTFEVKRPDGETETVRLYAVYAPESAQSYGTKARREVRQTIRGKNVRVSVEEEESRRENVVASVTVEGQDLGAMLVRDGLAWYYRYYAPDEEKYADLQREARMAGRGLWSQPDPTPPWQWRDSRSGEPKDDKDCSDFGSYRVALQFFRKHQPGDPHKLDVDGNGKPCEGLPGSP